jgi:hypothetical protein
MAPPSDTQGESPVNTTTTTMTNATTSDTNVTAAPEEE